MSREEIQKLLGGYATDTLSEAERSALFAAALEDQELFDALAKEQALRDVLQDPAARHQLIAALGPARQPLRWLRQPAVWAMAGSLAGLLIVAALVVRQARQAARREVIVADAITQPPPAAVPPSAVPLNAAKPPVVAHQPKRLAQLPAGRGMPAPAPSAHAAEARRQVAITAGQSPVPQAGRPMQPMSLAKAKASARAGLAVPYTLLLKDADGAYSPVPADTVFHTGDSVRLQVEPGAPGYVYLFQRDAATAGWKLVTNQRVENAQRCVLPGTGGIESDVPAQLELLLVRTRQQQPAPVTPETAEAGALPSVRITLEFR